MLTLVPLPAARSETEGVEPGGRGTKGHGGQRAPLSRARAVHGQVSSVPPLHRTPESTQIPSVKL